jgi:uncharacterized membrane protein YkvA (DUF1232 family)
MIERLRLWAQRLKRDLVAVSMAARDPRTPRSARLLALFVVAYALSPIDLIPDAVPVLGLIDDLLLIPIGLWLVIRLIPTPVIEEHRRAAEGADRLPDSRIAAVGIVVLWIALAAAGTAWLL